MSIKATTKREHVARTGLKTHHWIHYPTQVVLEGEGGFLSVWTQRDPQTYTGYSIIIGEHLYANSRPYDPQQDKSR